MNSPFIDYLTCSCTLTDTNGGQGGQFEGRYSGRSGYCSHCRSPFSEYVQYDFLYKEIPFSIAMSERYDNIICSVDNETTFVL